MADEAINFMVVAINGSWKVNVGHFFIKGLDAQKRKEMLTSCITKLHATGAILTSVTFDGVSANLSAMNLLGASLFRFPFPLTSFNHPVTGKPVLIILDVVHMIKLIRNTLGSKKVLIDPDGNEIKWNYFQALEMLQDYLGGHFANRVTDLHINYYKKTHEC